MPEYLIYHFTRNSGSVYAFYYLWSIDCAIFWCQLWCVMLVCFSFKNATEIFLLLKLAARVLSLFYFLWFYWFSIELFFKKKFRYQFWKHEISSSLDYLARTFWVTQMATSSYMYSTCHMMWWWNIFWCRFDIKMFIEATKKNILLLIIWIWIDT